MSYDLFTACIIASGLPRPIAEHRFHEARKWRFDYAWPEQRVALEIEGGVYTGGRHTRGKGFEKDCEKYNAATLAGWRVFRVTTGMLNDGRALAILSEALQPAGDVGE
jgi:very-short-patch-repair endonuclease